MSYKSIPDDYHLALTVDLKKDRTLARLLNIIATIIFLIFLIVAYLIKPFPYGAEFELIHVIVLILGLTLYVLLHELVHAIFMRLFLKERVRFGIHIWAAYAGVKDGLFNRKEYLMIALAPVVLLGAVIIALLTLVLTGVIIDTNWYWPLVIIAGQNFAGAIGDYYVIKELLKKSPRVIVNDDGMRMRYYEPGPDIKLPKPGTDLSDVF